MSVQVLKYNSNESQTYNTTRNICSINIPQEVGVADFSSSYISLFTKINTLNVLDEVADDAVRDVGLLYDPPSSLIKNVKISCDKYGILEEIKNVNILNVSVQKFTQDEEMVQSNCVFGWSSYEI